MNYNEANLLTTGALGQILNNQRPSNPILQIIGFKPMTDSDENRFRLMLGDGVRTHQYCVTANQDMIRDMRDGKLEKFSVIKVTNYQSHDYGDDQKRLIYILDVELVKKGSEIGKRITADENIIMVPTDKPPRSNAHHDSQTIGIGELTPYIGKWLIKGRVTSKGAIREYNNARGSGKLFSFTLADKTGEIKVTAFNTDLERIYPFVEPNKVYLLGRASVKNADKRYTTADFEITFNSDSLLEEVSDMREASDVPLAKFNFVGIGQLSGLPPNQPVDLIGVIHQVSDMTTIMSKTKNKELKKRNIVIVDMSRHSISVTIWGDQAETFSASTGDVFVSKSCRVGTYGGRSASAGDCMFINPDIPETRKMKSWYDRLLEHNFTALTAASDSSTGNDQWKCLKDLTNLEEARNVLASGNVSSQYAKAKITLLSVGKNPVYKCCPTDKCGKKLVDTQVGEMRCEKCQQSYTSCKYRFMTSVEIADFTDSAWVTLWDEKSESVLKVSPEEMERIMRQDNKEQYERVINRPNFRSFIMTLRVSLDTYNNEQRVRLGVANISPLDPVQYSKRLIEEIKTMSAQ